MHRTTQLTALALVTVALVALVAPATAATDGSTLAQTQLNNSTSTQTPTLSPTTAADGSADTCDPRAGGAKLQQARLYSPEPTITSGEHGKIAGSIALDIQNECDVVVQITMSVPSGMYIAGADDLSSGGGGIVTSTFEVQPGEVKSLRANVYSSSLGEKTVTADITYYPEGHKDMAREMDGIMMTFDVEGENMPDDPRTPSPDSATTPAAGGGGGDRGSGPGVLEWVLGLVSVTQIGLLVLVGLGMLLITRAVPGEIDLDVLLGRK